ncbi:MAG: hypothetical protein MJ179_09405, partial [Treponema sp.]|nr:hypothetical protein [Treponema sp.]
MKKNKIISILLLFITAFFFSCKNEIKIHTPENNGQSFTITGKIENPHNQLGARYVQPDVSSFVYKITAKNGANTVTSTSTTATYTISLTKGTWTLIVEGFLGNDEDVVNSSTAVLISDEIPFQVIDDTSTPEVASLKIKSDTNGEIDLSIIVTDPSIKSCSLIINGGTAINETVSNSKVHFSKSSLSTGTYSALFTFYDVLGDEICSYSDVITILAGQKTAKFVNNGNPFIDVSGNFNVTEEIVSRLHDKTVYVSFTNQPSNGKIPSGKIIDPFPNLQTAVDYINRSNKGEDSYYIKILNNIIADYSTDSVFCNIESVKDLDLTIESYGSEIYTINASKQPSNPGRAFNISGKNDSQLNLTLKNIKVTGGFMEAETGSQAAEGVYIGENATLKLDGNVDIQSVGGAQDGCVIVAGTILSDSKFVYIPVSYTVGTQLVSGGGLSQIAGNITIPDTVSGGVTQNWSISAAGKLIAAKVYISQMIELPLAGDTVYVRSPEDLLALAGFVNEGKYKVSDSLTIDHGTPFSFEGIVIEQEKPVSLSGKTWIPIGKASNTFKGTYKGGNKSITDLTIGNAGVDKVGLFGYTENAEIYDLTVSSTMDITTDTPKYVGIICAYAVNTTFNDCTVTGKIQITKAFSGAKIGGICGESSDGTFINCTSNLDKISLVNGNSYALGGIAGCVQSDVIDNCTNKSSLEILNASELTSDYIGGIAGYCGEVTLINSFNENSIKVPTSMCYSGGIAGVYWSYDDEYGYIQNCYANITFSGGFFGGILGAVVLDEDFVKIQNCVADITLNNYIEGAIYGITDCECGDYEITVFIENCFWNNSALPIYPIEIPGTTTSNNSPFASSSDQWYGELDYPVTCDSDKKTKALVYALNSWVNQQNSSGSTQYKNWCVSDGKLTFGTQPSVSEPPYYVSAQNYNVS